jgi:hypothetical protein
MSDIDWMREMRRLVEPPQLARVEMGTLAFKLAKADAQERGGGEPLPPGCPPGTTFMGVPLTVSEDIDPWSWRLFDRWGEVMLTDRIGAAPAERIICSDVS